MTISTSAKDNSAVDLWIVHGQIDMPMYIQVPPGQKGLGRIHVNLGRDCDGFIELRPLDNERATTPVFWTASKPIVYEFRAGVKAPHSGIALVRGMELAEHLADRLTLLTGSPVRPLSIGLVYDEHQLKECKSGKRSEFECTMGGEDAFRTQPSRNNSSLPQILAAPEHAAEAIRWFRHAMLFPRPSDQFLAYYISKESIAKHVPGVPRQQSSCTKCGEEFGTERWETAALRFLIARRPQLPADFGKALARIRARIAHGSADFDTLELARVNLPALQRIAVDGIALALGVDPDSLNFVAPRPINLVAPVVIATYSPDADPATDWGNLLSDQFAATMSRRGGKRSAAMDAPL